jgi:hypothetical protein
MKILKASLLLTTSACVSSVGCVSVSSSQHPTTWKQAKKIDSGYVLTTQTGNFNPQKYSKELALTGSTPNGTTITALPLTETYVKSLAVEHIQKITNEESKKKNFSPQQKGEFFQKSLKSVASHFAGDKICFKINTSSWVRDASESDKWMFSLHNVQTDALIPSTLTLNEAPATGIPGETYIASGLLCSMKKFNLLQGVELRMLPRFELNTQEIVLRWEFASP